ncbi:hypothetical protein RHMOL_Rhmol05G0213800 [Rhododendron molle]|uniref:Uncharacterized protein n=1 Tax=Rhododendron molle TaxID=49168 RepID=A0ACC0NSJ2_RHOML|nr:hypothetical protein RHMOL_Rhmol05G0213800 [Rhododendron molle]
MWESSPPSKVEDHFTNLGRRFLGCANYEINEKRCKYFYGLIHRQGRTNWRQRMLS